MRDLYLLWMVIGASMYFSLTMFLCLVFMDRLRNRLTRRAITKMSEKGYVLIEPTLEKAITKLPSFTNDSDSILYGSYGGYSVNSLGDRPIRKILGDDNIFMRRTGLPATGLTAKKQSWIKDEKGILSDGDSLAYLMARYHKEPALPEKREAIEEFLSMDKEAIEVEIAMYKAAS